MWELRQILPRAITLLLILTVVTIWGCSDSITQAPGNGDTALDSGPRDDGSGQTDPPEVVSGTEIDANTGGTIDIANSKDAAACRLIVPAHALDSNTTITAELREVWEADSSYLDFDFGPDGLTFNQPVVLVIDVNLFADPNLKYVDWFWYHPCANRWVLQGRFIPRNGQIKIILNHFSKYRGLSQGGQTGGDQQMK